MTQNKRIALVIGNSNYGNANDVSGVEDAKAMVACLRDLEFEVDDPILDGTLEVMRNALEKFATEIPEASVVLFFYAGHGFQLQGKNYLLPTDGDISPTLSIPLQQVLGTLAFAPNAVKFVFLDACRDEKRLPPGELKGLADPGPAPTGVLQAFAASPGQLAASGSVDELSLYTMALLRYIREPGLDLVKFFDKVRADVVRDSPRGQQPVIAGVLPQDFFFSDPVFVQAKAHGWPHKTPLVILNGEVVMAPDQKREKSLRLNAGENHLAVLISHGKTYHNGQVWGRTEGWSYKLDLVLPGENGDRTVTFKGDEKVPFKDGPHHGQTFFVARATLFVDPVTAQVSVQDQVTDLAHRDSPFWAQDQEILFQAKLVDLQISPNDILGGLIDFSLAPILTPFLARFLKTGKILNTLVVDPNKTFVAVRGNKALRSVAEHCMTQGWPDRLRDLRASFAAFFNDRHPRPFDVFAEGLDACVRANAPAFGITLASTDLRVWTSLDDLSPSAPEVVEPAAETTAATPASRGPEAPSDPSLMALAQEAILHPRPDEALIDTRFIEQVVQGVPIRSQVYTFLSVEPLDDKIRMRARVIADLSDLQSKIGPLIDTIPLPADNCSHFGLDNIVARIWGKQITVNGNVGTLKLNGNVEVWTCLKNPVQCSKVEWDGLVPKFVFWDCNPPIKNRNLSQPFDATLPFTVEVVDALSFALRLGTPSVDLGGPLGGVTEGILKIAGVDVNARVKEALDSVINPDSLKQTLPEFLLRYNPTLTRAELLDNSGALALSLEIDATLDFNALGELIQELLSQQ